MNTLYYALPKINNIKTYNSSYSYYAPTAGGTADTQALVGNGVTTAPKWVDISPSCAWTAGTTAGPTLKVTVLGQTQATGATIPYASTTASGIVTTDSQSFKGDKTFQSNVFRILNTNGNTGQAGSNPYITSLHIGDGSEITLDEYKDGYLSIHAKNGLLLYPQTNRPAVYSASSSYSVGTIVWYSSQYYRCKTAIGSGGEAWNSAHWEALPVGVGKIVGSGHFLPTVTDTYGLGNANNQWQACHLSQHLYIYNNDLATSHANNNPYARIGDYANEHLDLYGDGIESRESGDLSILHLNGTTVSVEGSEGLKVNHGPVNISGGNINLDIGLNLNLIENSLYNTYSSIRWLDEDLTERAKFRVPSYKINSTEKEKQQCYPAPTCYHDITSTTGERHLGLTNAFLSISYKGSSTTRNGYVGRDLSVLNNTQSGTFVYDHTFQPGDILTVHFKTATTASDVALHIPRNTDLGNGAVPSTSTYQTLRMFKGTMSAIGAISAGTTITFIVYYTIPSSYGGIGNFSSYELVLYKIAQC